MTHRRVERAEERAAHLAAKPFAEAKITAGDKSQRGTIRLRAAISALCGPVRSISLNVRSLAFSQTSADGIGLFSVRVGAQLAGQQSELLPIDWPLRMGAVCPLGRLHVSAEVRQTSGWSRRRQDSILASFVQRWRRVERQQQQQ